MPENSATDPQEQEIERLKGSLKTAQGVCHEMKQPLMIISAHLELMLMKDPDNSELPDKISKINFQLQRLSELTTRLMNIIQ